MADSDIAIVGLAARLPDALTPGQFWDNLRAGHESVRTLSEEEMLAAGATRELLARPDYVRAAATLDGLADFDAEFFGFSPKEAAILDPQHRQFLEAAWEAMEDAGHVPDSFDGAIGMFAGCGMNGYFMFNLLTNPELVREVGLFLLRHTGNDKDFLATRASYLFNLRGPSINVQTACSTSLVATHLAVQHLLSGECDLALAGGVTIEIPHARGYKYEEGEVLSPDGHCRAFDHRAAGTVFGSGVGVVALRRLEDAIDDGDQIYAVLKGTAVNNDGAQKVGYLAPSVDGQAACVAEALAVADVDPETISYIECHGTGTAMGDPIEIAALTQAFRTGTDKTEFCRIGSVKTNIGHLDTAAGVASLIKVSLALRNGEIPPSLNFEEHNPRIDFEHSPFYVNDRLSDWRREGSDPRRAGVNSLGVGGTNAFVVVEEAPSLPSSPSAEGWQLLVLSGRSKGAVDGNAARLAAHLRANPDLDLADVAWTLQKGRRHFGERRVVAARTVAEAAELLEANDARRVFTHTAPASERTVAFMFPGGGTQYPAMAADLHASEPVFAQHLDAGLDRLHSVHGIDLRPWLLGDVDLAAAAEAFDAPGTQLPAIFLVEYALAQLLLSWGIRPDALIGHSVGENTAACVAGTMSFDDCLDLVVLRGQLVDRVPGGTVVVPLTEEEIAPLVAEFDLDLAVVNAPDLCVVSGSVEGLAPFEERLRSQGIEPQRVRMKTAAHSRLFDVLLPEYRARLESMTLSPPTIPWVSNRTGTWITPEQATDPEYWVGHFRHTVRFSDGISTLAADPNRVLLEVGPGKTLSSLARMNPAFTASSASIPTMRHPEEVVDDGAFLLTTLGRLWAAGVAIDVDRLFPDGPRRRIGLPTYAFQTQRYFIEPGASRGTDEPDAGFVNRDDDEDRWFWAPVWRSNDGDEPVTDPQTWLVLLDGASAAEEVVARLRATGDDVVVVRTGDAYQRISDNEYLLAPEHGRYGYDQLVRDLARTGHVPDRIAHLGLLADDDRTYRPGSSFFHRNQEQGFHSLVFLAQAWAAEGLSRPLHVAVATMGAQRATDDDTVPWPEQSTVLGPVRLLSREFPDVTASAFDVDPDDLAVEGRFRARLAELVDRLDGAVSGRKGGADAERPSRREAAVAAIVDELRRPASNDVVALRGDRRYVHEVRRVEVPDVAAADSPLRQGGVVLITGGLGGIGLTVAEELHASRGAKLALLSRSPMPERDTWDDLAARLGDDHPTTSRIRRIRALEAAGAEVLLLAADVTDVAAVRAAADEVRRRFGGIHAVVHGAGVIGDELLVVKSQADMEDVLAPKVYGTLVLEEVLADDELDLFAVFSSTSTVTAPVGQTDYVAANAFLNAFAESRQAAGGRHVVALNWGIWNEVGMAAESAAGMLDRGDHGPEEEATHPYLRTRAVDRKGVARLTGTWRPEAEWFLDDHRTGAGQALLPGAGYLELARAALAEIGVDQPFELRDLTFLRPLAVADGTELDVSVVLTPTESGYRFDVRERVVLGETSAEGGPGTGRPGWRRTAEASLLLGTLTRPADLDLAALEAEHPRRGPVRTHQQDHLRFGPRWDVVQRVQLGDGSAMAWLALDDAFAGDLDAWALHPALVDLGTGFAMDLIDGYTGESLWVPLDYSSIRIHGALPKEVVAVATAKQGSTEASGFATFDVTLCRPDGQVAVQVEGFTVKKLDGELDLGLDRPPAPADVELDQVATADRQLSTSELTFQHNLRQGIVPDEGRRTFARAVAGTRRPVVYVSSLDIGALRAQSDAAARALARSDAGESGITFSRPELDSEYVEARNDVEAALVAMWTELLGVSDIGVLDNFFDLGGHSLIAVRMFAKVKKTFAVDFPISILFEAPTIEAVGGLISAAMPQQEGADTSGADDGATSTVAAAPPRYTHLVAMHAGEPGTKTPFFLVAGMFGNVLNLRHLAHQVGTDRPFYGVQAKGLYGGEDPHDTFVEAAEAYLAEIREVQPHGPYLLGGFSGGGITAFEMAQQLTAAGEEVGLLVFLDTATSFNPALKPTERVRIQVDNLRERGPKYVQEWAVNRVKWYSEKRRRQAVTDGAEGAAPPDTGDGVLHSTAIEGAFYRSLAAYDTKYWPGVISLFRPRLTPLHVFGPDRQIDINRRFIYPDNGWGPFCERVDVIEVPGSHDSMVLEPNVRVLAGHIRAAILAAEERAG